MTTAGHKSIHGGGESVGDLVRRLEHSVLEIESRLAPVLVVAHAAPCRALRAYLLGLPLLDALNAGSADDNADGAAALADGGHAIVELRPLDAKLGFEEHRVSQLIVHPSYGPAPASGFATDSDFALLRLATPSAHASIPLPAQLSTADLARLYSF